LCICVAIIFIYKTIILKEKPDYVLALSGTILLLGGLIMLLSPSLQWRIAEQGMDYAGLSDRIIEYGKRFAYYLLRYAPLILILLFGYKKNRIGILQWYLLSILICSSLSMFVAPLYEPRTAIFGFMITAMLAVSMVDWNYGIKRNFVYAIIALSIIVSLIRVSIFQKNYQFFPDNITRLEDNRNGSKALLKPQCYNATSGLIICEEIADDPEFIDNKTLAAYYNIDTVVLDNVYSTDKRKQNFVESIRADARFLDSYIRQDENDKDIQIFYKKTDLGLEIICEVKKNVTIPERSSIIIRGRKKGITTNSIIRFLSHELQVPFLDYLEYTGDNDMKEGSVIKLEGNRKIYYNHLLLPDRYDSVLISLYDLDNHTRVGEICELNY